MIPRSGLSPLLRRASSCISQRPLSAAQRPASFLSRQRWKPVTASPTLLLVLRRSLSSDTRVAIDKAVASAPVVLFMKGTPDLPQCGFSRASLQVLSLQGVDPKKFTAFNVLEDQDLRQGIKEYSEWPTIPQLYVNKAFVGGCDILVSMHQNGELASLLEKEGVLAVDQDVHAEGDQSDQNKQDK